MSKVKPVLLLCLVFFAGIAVGVIGHRTAARHFIRTHGPNPDFWRETILKELATELQLTEEQQKPVREIFLDTERRLKELRKELGPKFGGIMREAEEKVRQTLTPEQQEKYEKFLKEKKERWRGHDGSPRPPFDGKSRFRDREKPPRETTNGATGS